MAYKIIDDETALTIFEAIQENATRSFARYNCLRQLPKHKVSGELVFYLDELLDFAERELQQDPAETLGQVLDFGLTAWFGNLAPALQRKAGFSLKGISESSTPDTLDTPSTTSEANVPTEVKEALKLLTQKNKIVTELTAENARLKENIETLAAEKIRLKRELTHLEQLAEEFGDQSTGKSMPGYSTDPSSQQSGYMALTTHSLTMPNSNSSDNSAASSGAKKSKKRRKRKGGPNPPAQGGRPQ